MPRPLLDSVKNGHSFAASKEAVLPWPYAHPVSSEPAKRFCISGYLKSQISFQAEGHGRRSDGRAVEGSEATAKLPRPRAGPCGRLKPLPSATRISPRFSVLFCLAPFLSRRGRSWRAAARRRHRDRYLRRRQRPRRRQRNHGLRRLGRRSPRLRIRSTELSLRNAGRGNSAAPYVSKPCLFSGPTAG